MLQRSVLILVIGLLLISAHTQCSELAKYSQHKKRKFDRPNDEQLSLELDTLVNLIKQKRAVLLYAEANPHSTVEIVETIRMQETHLIESKKHLVGQLSFGYYVRYLKQQFPHALYTGDALSHEQLCQYTLPLPKELINLVMGYSWQHQCYHAIYSNNHGTINQIVLYNKGAPADDDKVHILIDQASRYDYDYPDGVLASLRFVEQQQLQEMKALFALSPEESGDMLGALVQGGKVSCRTARMFQEGKLCYVPA